MAIVAMGRYGGFELSYGSDADVMFVHDPAEGADPQVASTYAQAVANELRRLLAAARRRPGARGRRRPAARGQAGAAGAHPRLLRGLLRQVVAGLGGAGAAARRRGRRRRGPAPAVHRADRPAALPGRRASAHDDVDRDPPDQGAGRRRAAAARRRPATPTSSSAAADWPTSSGPSSCSRCGTPASIPGCARPRTLDALAAAAEAGLLDADGRRVAGRTAGARSAGSATPSPWSAASPATSCPATPGRGPPSPACMGYPPGASDEMVNDYLRHTRRARAVVDRVFWG